MANTQQVDILILGGGAGGLSAALTLARQLHTAVVFNHGVHRNAISSHMHNILTWDNHHPEEFIKAGKANLLANYQTIRFCDSEVVKVKKTETGYFEAHTAGDEAPIWTGSKLILATGVEDILPDLPGYRDCWLAKSIFHCFFCHGYEERGSDTAGILAIDGLTAAAPALHFARNAKRFAKHVTIYTHGGVELATQLKEALGSATDFAVESREIAKLVKGDRGAEVIVQLAGDDEQRQAFLGHKPRNRMNGPWADQLGLEMALSGDPKVTPPFFATSVPGVFACGDLSSPLKIVPNAMLSGAAAGAGACAELQAQMMGQESMVSVASKG